MSILFDENTSSFGLTSVDPMLAGINETDELRLASVAEGPEDEVLKASNVEDGADELLLAQNGPGVLKIGKSGAEILEESSSGKSPPKGKDTLTGEGDEVVVGEVDSLTGGSSDREEIEVRARKKRDNAGNSRSKAQDLGVLNDVREFQEFVGKSDRKDFYQFELEEKTDVEIELDGLSGNADLYLLNDKGKVIEKSKAGGKKAENIEETLNPGIYYARVESRNRKVNTDYNLSFDAESPDVADNSRETAQDLGILNDVREFQEFVGKSDRKDFYQFKLEEKTDVEIELDGLSGNADLYLLNDKGKVIEKSKAGGKKAENIERSLNPGIYYARVESRNRKVNTDYNLSLTATESVVELPHGEPIVVDLPELPVTMADNLSSDFRDDGSTIDVMIVYSPQARQAKGGTDGIKKSIESSVDRANQAFANSGVNPRLRLVHSAEVNYQETGQSSLDLERLKGTNDGYMDEVHALRDQYGADIVSLFVSELDYGGVGYLTRNDARYENLAFNVVHLGSAERSQTFAHEVGHNLGLSHDRRNSSGAEAAFDYGYGYATYNDFGTVMSYAHTYNAERIDYFSNPNVTYNGKPTGTFSENAVKAINDIAYSAANWRQSVDRTISNSDYVTLTSPNGSETVKPGKKLNITWNDNINETVKLELYKGNSKVATIADGTASDGSYEWQVPQNLASGSNYKINIQSVSDSSVFDLSDNYFAVEVDEYVKVISPNGGNILQPGSIHNIIWDDNISENVDIYLYGGSYSLIASSTPSDGSYAWNVPSNLAADTDYWIYIQKAADNSIYDFSDDSFSASAADYITVTSHNSGNTLYGGGSSTITWEDNISENVQIFLLKAGEYQYTIADSTPSDGSYTWNIPSDLASGNDYEILIRSIENFELLDTNNTYFEIANNNNNSDLYYFTYFYDGGDSYNGFFYGEPGSYSLYDFLESSSGFYYINDVGVGAGTKDEIGDVYVYSYYDGNYTGGNYEPFFWSLGVTSGANGLGSEFDYILEVFDYDYFDPNKEADGLI